MNKTAQQLWWDKEFIETRIKIQQEYIHESSCKYLIFQRGINVPPRVYKTFSSTLIFTDRGVEVLESAYYILNRLKRQLERINKLK